MTVVIDTASSASAKRPVRQRTIELGLVNNMPDSALESTERQFCSLITAAAGTVPVRLRLFALPEVPRGEVGRAHLRAAYAPIDELWTSRLDGLIVTGTEPRAASLKDEPYWASLANVLGWAQENTASTIWSCLAAHAAVLQLDGIGRQALQEKRFGVFPCPNESNHSLMAGLPLQVRVAHSRWNEVMEPALAQCGYTILTRSTEAGVDAFAKQGKSLFVFFQGHPEYDERALLREYRRDIGRYLRRERETYPTLPSGYFDEAGVAAAMTFRERALAQRDTALLKSFPSAFLEHRLLPQSGAAVSRFYRNWLSYLDAHRPRVPRSASTPQRSRLPAAN
jgi:homoserine O-succinyltransferase/O-acetyltransferase